MPTPRDEQNEYNFTIMIGQFFEEMKVQSRTKIDNQRSVKIRILLAKKMCWKLFLRVFIPQAKNPSFSNESHINLI
jgi:hypothetical protein